MEREVPIRVFTTRAEAELARGRLESAGIPAWVLTDDANGVYPFELSGGARLVVRARDRDAASSVLGPSA